MPEAEPRIVFSCEHGGHRIPREFAPLFAGQARLVASHWGWDAGALAMARPLARSMGAPLVAATTTRLLVDLNRSPANPRVFSPTTRTLARPDRDALLARYHAPHWDRVVEAVAPRRPASTTLHIAVHSFTPSLEGMARPFAIGLLYDPGRAREQRFAKAWQQALREHLSRGQVRRNAPYRGDSDGLTTALRKRYPERGYLGIELELNQARIASGPARRALGRILVETLLRALRSAAPA